MHITVKKFFMFLTLAIVVVTLLLVLQFRRALSITVRGQNEPVVSTVLYPIPETPTDTVLGNPGASLTIVEFVDLGNKKSVALHNTFADFVLKNPTKARLIWKDYPESSIFSGDATAAHVAVYCAGLQKQFWSFLNAVIEVKALTMPSLEKVAEKSALNVSLWRSCAVSPDTIRDVEKHIEQARQLGVTSAPAVFINNKKINTSADIHWDQMLKSFIED